MKTHNADPKGAADGRSRCVDLHHPPRHGVTVPCLLILLLTGAAAGFAGGARELHDYAPSPPAAQMLAEYERVQADGFARQGAAPSPEPAQVMADIQRWRERCETLHDDAAAYHYLRARIEYDAYHRLASSDGDARAGYLDRALEHIKRFAEHNVRFADGYALHGAVLGQKIAANPASAMLLARAAKQATTTALHLDPDHQLAHLNLAFTFANAPKAFGGDRKLAVKHFRKAFAGGAPALRAVAGVWLSVTYDQLGEPERAAEAIAQVLEFAPRFPPAVATARALAAGDDPALYLERLQ